MKMTVTTKIIIMQILTKGKSSKYHVFIDVHTMMNMLLHVQEVLCRAGSHNLMSCRLYFRLTHKLAAVEDLICYYQTVNVLEGLLRQNQ